MKQILEAIKNVFGIVLLFLYGLFLTIILYWPVIAMLCVFALLLALISPIAGMIFAIWFFIVFVIWFIIKLTQY